MHSILQYNPITDYIVEWSALDEFVDSNSTTFTMIYGENEAIDCRDKCKVTIGGGIKNLTFRHYQYQ
jgi:hypothetical protein